MKSFILREQSRNDERMEKGTYRMKVISNVLKMRRISSELKQMGKSVGLVPTMGYLHEGHISLIKRSVSENDVTIVSIFVNPIQFGSGEDLNSYPRDFEKDREICEDFNVDYIFSPSAEDMYPNEFYSFVDIEILTETLCGKKRPGHFRGVLTVVSKLFNISRADRAYFGAKDIQQLLIVKKMVDDLNMNVEIVACETVREEDGLAKSSRNIHLSEEERKAAAVIKRSLDIAENMIIKKGTTKSKAVIQAIRSELLSEPLVSIDYVEIVSANNLKPVEDIKDIISKENIVLAIAVIIGETRLIDNVVVNKQTMRK